MQVKLQWGRVPEDAEIRSGDPGTTGSRCFNGAASLKTRKFGQAIREQLDLAASMGRVPEDAEIRPATTTCWLGVRGFNGAASLKTRKFATKSIYRRGILTLQWGRVPEDAEMWHRTGQQAGYCALQWGRVPEDAEMTCCGTTTTANWRLQWGRVPEDAEMDERFPSRRTKQYASMGPRP